MYTYIGAFIILLLVFSITIAVSRPQPAAVSLPPQATSQGTFLTKIFGSNPIFGFGRASSAGGSHPTAQPKDNYQCYFESCPNQGLFGSFNNIGFSNTFSNNPQPQQTNQNQDYDPISGVNFGVFSQEILLSGNQPGGNVLGEQTGTAVAGLPETSVISGPDKTTDFVLDEATFTFGGFLVGSSENVSFETRLIGGNEYDASWRHTTKREITYQLNLKGVRNLVFEVRAMTADRRYDPTPAQWPFRLSHSQLWDTVGIGSIISGRGQLTQLNYEAVSIHSRTNQTISVSNWKLADLTTRAMSIGQAVEILQPNPSFNAQNADVVLFPYGSVAIHTGSSPIGFSYRENSCTGLLGTKPLADNQEYSDCYFRERLKEDFLKNSWHVYLNSSVTLWDEHSTMFLFDRLGAVVDITKY